MAVRDMTWPFVTARYANLRRRYFLDSAGANLPPAARELTWAWLPTTSPAFAYTHFDEENDPHLVELNPKLRESGWVLDLVLLHELTHMRLGPDVSCSHRSRAWRAEMRRLMALGAVRV